ncbi:signal peptidase II [Corynebacterium sp. sy017]|uniref:signal peptidase II n=1 Tax=unclassified Corynebacterium TaxID=2624378 RepID=UPI0011868431|nr:MULTISPECIES: signal peptidase II [unclassified Corynebacterium]MBP3087943.1 signal peptidase II [Corynebacterium sp. sy017]QDZ43571.1 signal peptidase II [Corynebacterium sp. sy039]TSD92749.1 signal peptidase II [Corynebacterium sp. SY003]
MIVIALIVAILDQLTKTLMLDLLEDGPLYLIGDWFRFRLLFNSGAAFSIGQNSTWLFTCIQIAFICGISVYARKIEDIYSATGLALIAGGALGNLYDRLTREPGFFVGHVVDFISVGNFAVFNVADSAISVGVVIFLCSLFLSAAPQGEKDA